MAVVNIGRQKCFTCESKCDASSIKCFSLWMRMMCSLIWWKALCYQCCSVGYPVVTMGFSIKSCISYRFRLVSITLCPQKN